MTLVVWAAVPLPALSQQEGGKAFETLAEGEMLGGGTWRVSGQAFPHEQTVCWDIETRKTEPVFPPLPTPTQTRGFGSTRCNTRPPPGRLGHHVALVRCDADTAIVVGSMGSRVRNLRARTAAGATIPLTVVALRPDGLPKAPGYYGVFGLEQRPTSVVGVDRKSKQPRSAIILWPDCAEQASPSS